APLTSVTEARGAFAAALGTGQFAQLVGLSTQDGQMLWQRDVPAADAAQLSVVRAGGGWAYTDRRGEIVFLCPQGNELTRPQLPSEAATPAVRLFGGTSYVVSLAGSARLRAFEVASGKQVFFRDLSKPRHELLQGRVEKNTFYALGVSFDRAQ